MHIYSKISMLSFLSYCKMYRSARGISAAFVYLVLLHLCMDIIYACELRHGEECIDKRHFLRGICVPLTNCDYALNLIDKGESPKFCNGYEDNFNALVCCSYSGLQNEKNRTRISKKKCNEYYTELDTLYSFAIGGIKARPKEYDHMALVGYGAEDEINWSCGGSLISNKYVLTAAHCILTTAGEPEWVRLGELDTATKEDDADPQNFAVVKTIVHPDYQVSSVYNDIGLLELDRQVNFTLYIRPACLPQCHTVPGQFAIATGWGHTAFQGKPSSHLIEVDLILVNQSSCNKIFRGANKGQLSTGINDKSQMCAGGNDGKDTCQGDSGGPLQIKKLESTPLRSIFDVIGITSFGAACGIGNIPGVYTRVFFYLDWIESIVWP